MRPPRDLYPFDSHYFDRGGGVRLHYLDEGEGDPVVMVHGNPTWSFYYRNLAADLRRDHRVIVPDHVGCGLSDKPGDDRYGYRLADRVGDLEALLEHLGVRERVTLVLHDWGGMIGMAWATRHPERVARLVLLNTAAFPLPTSKVFPWPLWLVRDTRAGAAMVSRWNAFSRVASRVAAKRPMSAAVREAYVMPYEQQGDRIATLRFVQDIPLRPSDPSWALVTDTASKLKGLRHLPAFICWGAKDFVFDRHFLAVWRDYLPMAEVTMYPDAGHYVLEDEAASIVPSVRGFLERTVPPGNKAERRAAGAAGEAGEAAAGDRQSKA
jgi:cis-3-alkyl-4-acyloxetan-2-one decarboxylase